MSVTQPRSDLARLTCDEFARYFEHMAARVDRTVRSVPAEPLWRKPFPFGNSIGHLVLHLTGNLNHYIGAMIAGTGYVREREHEFTDPNHPPVEELLASSTRPSPWSCSTLGSLDDQGFTVPVEHQRADRDPARPFPRLRRSHEQPHRPDELPGGRPLKPR